MVASVLVVMEEVSAPENVTVILIEDTRYALALFVNAALKNKNFSQ